VAPVASVRLLSQNVSVVLRKDGSAFTQVGFAQAGALGRVPNVLRSTQVEIF